MSDEPQPDDREARARAAIEAIAKGADPGAEAMRLANRFTDDLTRDVRRRWRREPRDPAR